MSITALTTKHSKLALAFAAFQTTAALSAPAPTRIRPSAGIPLPNLQDVKSKIVFTPLGVGTAAQTVDALLVGWYYNTDHGLWIPIELLNVTGTLGNTTAVGNNGATWRFCDAITIATGKGLEGTPHVTEVTKSEGGIAYVLVDQPAVEIVQFQVTKGTATSANVLAGSY